MIQLRLLLCAGVVAAVGGCTARTSVAIDVSGPAALTSLALDASVPGAATVHKTLSTKLPGRVIAFVPDVATTFSATVTAVDQSGATLTQTRSVQTIPHQQVVLAIDLSSAGDGGVVDLASDLPAPDGGADLAGDLGPVLQLVAGVPGGYGTVDDVGSLARLDHVAGVALVGNTLYFIDNNSGNLRFVDLNSKLVTTIPLNDGTGNGYTLDNANGLACDATYCYAAETDAAVIRKITIANGLVQTLAGTPYMTGTDSPALFNEPFGAALDGQGNLWITDSTNCAVRKIVLATGAVTTAVGTAGACDQTEPDSPPKFEHPTGLAFSGGKLYVLDDDSVRQIATPETAPAVTTFCRACGFGSTMVGIAGDANGNVYAVDEYGYVVYKLGFTGAGSATPVVGNTASTADEGPIGAQVRLVFPSFLVMDATGANAYLGDAAVVQKLGLGGNYPVSIVAGTQTHAGDLDGTRAQGNLLFHPRAMIADPSDPDTVYFIEDYGSGRLRRLKVSTGDVTTLVGGADDGRADGTGTAAGINSPSALAIDPNGNLWVADYYYNLIRYVTGARGAANSATVTTLNKQVLDLGMQESGYVNGPIATALFNRPQGLAYDSSTQRLYISDDGNNAIRVLDVQSMTVSTLTGNEPMDLSINTFDGPHGMVLDEQRHLLYVSAFWDSRVDVIDLTQASPTMQPAVGSGNYGSVGGSTTSAEMKYPDALALDPVKQILYIADGTDQQLRRADLVQRTVTTLYVGTPGVGRTVPGPLPANVHGPSGLALSSSGLVLGSLDENCILLAPP